MNPNDPFAEIRPYRDDEVRAVIERLLHDREFLHAIARMRHPLLSLLAGPVLRMAVQRTLRKVADGIDSVADFQLQVRHYLELALEDSADEVTASGYEALQPDRAYLYVCNHRDIAMDPALCNLVLHRHQLPTFRIAIGDNLLSKPWSSDLMRLNKSFIVKRGITGKRDKLEALKLLSQYIRHSITVDGSSIWIAQKEGRAKDGRDRTEPAVLKMFLLSRDREQPVADAIRELHIVPVAISYQWDPCDAEKANELAARDAGREFHKDAHFDIQSLARGITGYKGDIHVAFGDELSGQYDHVDDAVAEIDRQIIGMYRLHDSNRVARLRLSGEPIPAELENADRQLQGRLETLPADSQRKLLENYANPVISREQWLSPDPQRNDE